MSVTTKEITSRPTADSICTRIVTFKRDGYTVKLKSQLPSPTSIEDSIKEYNRQPK